MVVVYVDIKGTQLHHFGSVTTYIHKDNPEHRVDMDGVQILAVEQKWFQRGVGEAIHIRMEQPSLNKDGGRYNLPSSLAKVL